MQKEIIKFFFVVLTFILLFTAIFALSDSVYATTDCSGHNTLTCYDYVFRDGCCVARHATVPLNWCEVWCE
jgi:hypothetical protein